MGHYEQQLPVIDQDNLGFLVESFNEMTLRIARARDEMRMASMEVENQRSYSYLETIPSNLTAGVISFDSENRIRMANQASYRIFHFQVSGFVGRKLLNLAQEHKELAKPLQQIQNLIRIISGSSALLF